MTTNTTLQLAIQNLDLLSTVLEKSANNDKNFNTDFGYYLEQMAFTMHKNSNELKDIYYNHGGF